MIVGRSCIVALLAVVVSAGAAAAQCTAPRTMRLVFDDPRAELIRAAEVLGVVEGAPMFQRREMDRAVFCGDSVPVIGAWGEAVDSGGIGWRDVRLDVLAPSIRAVYHSAYPRERNNGALVEMVGLSTAVDFGVAARWKWLEVVLAPRLTYTANEEFEFPAGPVSRPFASPYHVSIDYPTRFGPESFNDFSAGASRIQAEVGPVRAGLSTANMWVGPAHRYPVIMSNTAPGFTHAYISTARPIDLRFFDLEVNMHWGEVEQSDWFIPRSPTKRHLVTGFELAVAPHFLPGLQVGFTRAYHDSLTVSDIGWDVGELFGRLLENPLLSTGGLQAGNALGGLYGRFVLPESGFEVFAEWTREDYTQDLDIALREPDWTQAYTLGFVKLYRSDDALARFYGEMIHLGESAQLRAGKGYFSYYTHSTVRQGHTNEGQILGAWVGPGSDAQIVGYDRYTPATRTHAYIERVRYDDDTYLRQFARRYGEARHDVELTLGVSHARRFGSIEVEGGLNASRRYDRMFINLEGFGGEKLIENNWNPWVRLRWQP